MPWNLDMPLPVAMALVAVIGYFFGRSQQRATGTSPQARRALDRAREIVRELEMISRQVRESVTRHRTCASNFRERLNEMARCKDGPVWEELAHEAENLLKPTLRLSAQVAHAYDSIRQQTHLLMALTEVRTDPLTGLGNRRSLDESVQSRLAMLERYGAPFAVAVFDIDHFKKVNDEQGHMEGDRILQEVAALLEECVRDTDSVTRFGGEEFVVVMPQTKLQGACIFSERTRQRVEEQLSVTISVGTTEAASGDDARGLLDRADSALYAAKDNGRNRVFCHDNETLRPLSAMEIEQADGPVLTDA